MSVVAQMDGLPANAEVNSVVLAVRKILQKLKIRFWVHDFTFSDETNTTKCKIEFYNKTEVPKAIEKLISKPQTILGVPCDLKIQILSEKSVKETIRDPSPSPLSKEEANIDKKMEQLKKEKEELEKRKTELLQKKKKFDQEPAWNYKMDHTTLPKNAAAENIILEQMKPILKPLVLKRYYQILLQRVHVEVRKKIAILVEETKKFNYSTRDVIKGYRFRHPAEGDAMMIKQILEEIKQAFWSYKAKNAEGVYEFDESSDEENNAPKESQAKDNSKKENGNANENVQEQNEMQMDTDEPKILENEPQMSEIEEPQATETSEPKTSETGEPKITEPEAPKPSDSEAPKIPDTEGPKIPDTEGPQIPDTEGTKIPDTEGPKIPDTEEQKILCSKEPGDILFEGGSDWNEEADKAKANAS